MSMTMRYGLASLEMWYGTRLDSASERRVSRSSPAISTLVTVALRSFRSAAGSLRSAGGSADTTGGGVVGGGVRARGGGSAGPCPGGRGSVFLISVSAGPCAPGNLFLISVDWATLVDWAVAAIGASNA